MIITLYRWAEKMRQFYLDGTGIRGFALEPSLSLTLCFSSTSLCTTFIPPLLLCTLSPPSASLLKPLPFPVPAHFQASFSPTLTASQTELNHSI